MWRGGGITQDQINEYAKMIGNGNYIRMHGYSSCSLDKSLATSFAWENAATGHSKVLFHIKYNLNAFAYFLDAGAYDYEKEVLLYDGVKLWVE